MVFINDPRVFLPRGALQYQTLSDSLKLSKAFGLCHSESRDGLSLDKYSSNALIGPEAGFSVFWGHRFVCDFCLVHPSVGRRQH